MENAHICFYYISRGGGVEGERERARSLYCYVKIHKLYISFSLFFNKGVLKSCIKKQTKKEKSKAINKYLA